MEEEVDNYITRLRKRVGEGEYERHKELVRLLARNLVIEDLLWEEISVSIRDVDKRTKLLQQRNQIVRDIHTEFRSLNIEIPTYPTSPYYSIVEGFVELQVYVKPDGTVEKAVIVNANPKRKFDNTALKAIKKSLFSKSIDGSIRCGIHSYHFRLSYF